MHEYVLDPEHWPAMPPLHRAFLEYAIPLFRTDTCLAGLAAGGSFVSGGLDAHSDLDLVVVSLLEASQDVLDAVASAGGRVCFVNLTCPIAELERRIVQPSRAECGGLQRGVPLRRAGAASATTTVAHVSPRRGFRYNPGELFFRQPFTVHTASRGDVRF